VVAATFFGGRSLPNNCTARPHLRRRGAAADRTRRGDAVMRGGSLWRAYATTSNKPPDDGWKLMIRKGRDGKDGKDGKDAH